MNNVYYGVWDPTTGRLPDVTGYDFAAYYILSSAIINNVSYKKDNWLVYFCSARGTAAESKIWRTTNALILSNPDSATNVPDPGYYTKVRLDNAGNIVDGDSLEYDDLPKELKDKVEQFTDDVLEEKICIVLSTIFQNSVLNPIKFKWDKNTKKLSADIKVDEETIKINSFGELYAEGVSSSSSSSDDNSQCAIHQHTSSQIADFESAVQNIINSYSLMNSLKNSLNSLVDGETIILNKNGQLASIATAVQAHSHTMDDISDLNQNIANVWASDQVIHKEEGDNFSDGALDMEGLSIKDILISFNSILLQYQSDIEELKTTSIGGKSLEPTEPNDIDTADFTLSGTVKSVIDITNGNKTTAYKSLYIETSDIIYTHGTVLSIYIDGVEELSVNCFDSSEGHYYVNQKYNGLTFTYIGDAYPKIKTFQGFYQGFTFKYENSDLSEGEHTIYFTTKVVGTIVEVKSKEYTFNIYKETSQNITYKVSDNISYSYISGIKTIKYNPMFDITIQALSYNSRFAPSDHLTVDFGDTIQELIPYKYENGYSYYNTISYIVEKDGYFTFKINKASIEGNEVSVNYKSDFINIDQSILESNYRVMLKSGSYDHTACEATSFTSYDSTIDLSSDEYMDINSYYYQAQIKDDIVITTYDNWKALGLGGDYTIKPNIGIIYLKFNSPYLHNFYLDLLNEDGNALETNKDGTLKNIELYAGFSDVDNIEYWIDCNSPFDGFSKYKDTKTFNGLDLFRSTETRKYITLGRDMFSDDKYLYLKIKITGISLNLKTLISSIEESLDERR